METEQKANDLWALPFSAKESVAGFYFVRISQEDLVKAWKQYWLSKMIKCYLCFALFYISHVLKAGTDSITEQGNF